MERARGAGPAIPPTSSPNLDPSADRAALLLALTESERRAADLFTHAPVGILITDAAGTILAANAADLEILGWPRAQYVGRLWRAFYVDPAEADDALARAARGERVADAEVPMRHRDGSTRWVRRTLAARLDESGAFLEARAFTRDATQHHAAKERLRESEERLRLLVDRTRGHTLINLAPDGHIISWSAAASRVFGWPDDGSRPPRHDLLFTSHDQADGLPARVLELAAAESTFVSEGWRVRRDGSRLWAETVVSVVRGLHDEILGYSQLTRDVSERRRLEVLRIRAEELEAKNRSVRAEVARHADLIEELSQVASEPLEALERAVPSVREGPQGPLLARTVTEAATSLRRALSGLRERALGPDRRSALPPELLDPARVALEVTELLKAEAAARQVRIEVIPDPALPTAVQDADAFRQILDHLLGQALQTSRERGRIFVRFGAEGESLLRIEVDDSSLGMSGEALAQLFSEPREGAGSGRPPAHGMAATRRLVEAQGGRMTAYSTPGRGTTVVVRLPRDVSRPRRLAQVLAVPRILRALVVSEDPSTRASLSWTLGSHGLECLAVESASAGVQVARERRLDVVAVDLFLESGATELVRALRSEVTSVTVPRVLAAVGVGTFGTAGLVGAELLGRPAPADQLFAALDRCQVPRGRKRPVLVVEREEPVVEALSRTLSRLDFQPVPEPDAEQVLRRCAKERPAAVLVSPFVLGLNAFQLLHRLRRLPGCDGVPILLLGPERWTEEQKAEVRGHAEQLLRETAGRSMWVVDGIEGTCPLDDPLEEAPEAGPER